MTALRCCIAVVCVIVCGVLQGIQTAHSATLTDSGINESDEYGLSDDQLSSTSDTGARNSYSRKVKADFHDVFAELEFAITEKNYRITGVNSIGRAITDRDGSAFPLASVVHFCNIEAAKEILEISMDYLLMMPCRVTLHELADGYVSIEARLLPLDDEKLRETALSVNALLRDIVDFAAGDW